MGITTEDIIFSGSWSGIVKRVIEADKALYSKQIG